MDCLKKGLYNSNDFQKIISGYLVKLGKELYNHAEIFYSETHDPKIIFYHPK
jgi:hypothetical protein